MIHPSEFTPATSALLIKLLSETFAQNQVAVVTGDAAAGRDFAALPRISDASALSPYRLTHLMMK
ncbi:hypothetical protein [Cupriavidus sp. YAF13]|uniref:hypothetical protein n=1 Tax=Cupriavidus sp. YAF13 TaxID=3233075 RepID=UPI003F926D81